MVRHAMNRQSRNFITAAQKFHEAANGRDVAGQRCWSIGGAGATDAAWRRNMRGRRWCATEYATRRCEYTYIYIWLCAQVWCLCFCDYKRKWIITQAIRARLDVFVFVCCFFFVWLCVHVVDFPKFVCWFNCAQISGGFRLITDTSRVTWWSKTGKMIHK